MGISIKEILQAFTVLFAIIDVTGSIPIVIKLKHQGMSIKPLQISLITFAVMVAFLIGGEQLLAAINVDLHAFALAGAFILLVYGIEMTLGVHIMRNDDCPEGTSAIIPLVFPLFAGAGALTTLISMRTTFAAVNIIIAVFLNIVLIYLMLKYIHTIERIIGPSAIYIITKLLGIVLLAVASKMFVDNLQALTL